MPDGRPIWVVKLKAIDTNVGEHGSSEAIWVEVIAERPPGRLAGGMAADPRALVFTGPKGAQLRRSNFTRAWSRATVAAGLSGFHFHDLRHTGNALAGEEGASLRELMERMGHSSPKAALIYQHRTMQRDKQIADAMGKRAQAELRRSGTQRARGTKKRS